MAEKLHEYEGWLGRLHAWRASLAAKLVVLRDALAEAAKTAREPPPPESAYNEDPTGLSHPSVAVLGPEYAHIFRRKTRGELIRLSAAVTGIELSYAAETAFVSPLLLQIGVQHRRMTLVWALSPMIGFFVTPFLGSLSDRCRSLYGRRRPFVALLAFGVLIGLLLVPNGADMGHAMGDFYPSKDLPRTNRTLEMDVDAKYPHPWGVFFTVLGTVLLDFDADACQSPARAYLLDVTLPEDHARGLSTFTVMAGLGGFFGYALGAINWDVTAIGAFLGGHVRAVFTLITFTFVICVAYTVTSFKEVPLPALENLRRRRSSVATPNFDKPPVAGRGDVQSNPEAIMLTSFQNTGIPQVYGSLNEDPNPEPGYEHITRTNDGRNSFAHDQVADDVTDEATLRHYLTSIVRLPSCLRRVCVTNLFCWSAHVCYSLYFTDFVGEAVYGGDPKAANGSPAKILFDDGVRFGCWGMSMYSLSCACYSLVIERLIKRFRLAFYDINPNFQVAIDVGDEAGSSDPLHLPADKTYKDMNAGSPIPVLSWQDIDLCLQRARTVYVGGLLFYSLGMLLMAITQHSFGVILFSWAAGVMYSTLFTMPYLLIAHYHDRGMFSSDGQVRGLGTDVAIVSSMVFLAQLLLSLFMGPLVAWWGSTTAVVATASTLAAAGAITATRVLYFDL